MASDIGEPDCGARHALARSDILGGDVCGRCGLPLGRMRRNCGLAPAELAFEDMPRAAVRFTYFAKTLVLTLALTLVGGVEVQAAANSLKLVLLPRC